jgi:hypothetical protein
MHLTIDFISDLESQLLDAAAKQGVDPTQYVVNAVRERLLADCAPNFDAIQSELLQEINCGLSQSDWTHYYDLVEKRRSETISDEELAKLAAMTSDIEARNVRRMERLATLARLRGTTLPKLMNQLGILPPPVI